MLRSQGLDRPRAAGRSTMRQFGGVVDRLGLLQIDSVNVLARAHLLPAFSRFGPYDTGLLDRAAGEPPRRLVECWAHEASYVPPATYRLLGWRQRAYREAAWGAIRSVPVQHAALLAEVRELVRDGGPVTAREVHARLAGDHPRARTAWGWNWTDAKRALEFLFFTGEVTAARRTPSFERSYDLTERVLPPDVVARPEPSDGEAFQALVEIAARSLGLGSLGCFADYFRIRRPGAVRQAVTELVEAGTLLPVRVRGWDRPLFRHREARVPRSATGAALVSPFDPVVWERRRLEELFGMRYRIEIYVPAERRRHGYYVLPFLLGETFAARVDLKGDRRAGVLRVQSAHPEAGAPPGTAADLVVELRRMAAWLGLDDVAVTAGAGGDLSVPLAAELARG